MLSKTLGSSRKFATTGKHAGEFPQLLYALALPHADDFGRQSGDAFTVKNRVFPSSPRTEDEFEAALVALEQAKLIIRYASGDETVMEIVKFDDHQQGLHKRTKSEFPDPPPTLPGNSGNAPEIPSELNLTEPNGTELNGTALDARFDVFWQAYPKKKSKGAALKVWHRIKPNTHVLERMRAALGWQGQQPDWVKDGGKFIPHPATWLNAKGWEDEPFHAPSVSAKTVQKMQGIYGD